MVPVYRVGVDLTAVAEVEEALADHGDRYLRRLFTDHEVASCQGTGGLRADSLAARFAAKEAAVKVLRPSGSRPEWRDIEVRRHDSGAFDLVLHRRAADLARSEGIDQVSVSLSHEAGMAMAVVVGWGSGLAGVTEAGSTAVTEAGSTAAGRGRRGLRRLLLRLRARARR